MTIMMMPETADGEPRPATQEETEAYIRQFVGGRSNTISLEVILNRLIDYERRIRALEEKLGERETTPT